MVSGISICNAIVVTEQHLHSGALSHREHSQQHLVLVANGEASTATQDKVDTVVLTGEGLDLFRTTHQLEQPLLQHLSHHA